MEILIMSCDSYEDTWQPFFKLYNKYFPNKYKTYVCTETKECEYATTIKTKGSWTLRLRQALEQINDKYVLLLLDDFFIREKVDIKLIEYCLTQFNDHIAVFNFEKSNSPQDRQSSIEGFKIRPSGVYYFNSCQPSIHDRLKLIERLQKDQTPWEWETSIINSKYEHYVNDKDFIIDIGYNIDRKPWGIVQGKWAVEMMKLDQKENLGIDFTKRGFKDLKLSIITPYYKTLEYTKKLYKVLKPQLTEEVEWIIVDDGCNEKELDKLADYNIKIIHKKNGGVSSARNRALSIAQGEYITFIDSDDSVVDNYVNKILDKTKENFDYCYMSWRYTNKRNDDVIIKDIPPQDNICVWNCIYKREKIKNIGFNEDTQYGEEMEFNLRARVGKKANIVEVMYLYNFDRENSATELYRLGKLDKYKPIKAQIVMFLKFVSKIGGVETFLYEFFKEFHDKHDIIFLYEESDPYQLARYRKFVKCRLYKGEKVECETFLNVNCTKNIANNVTATSGKYLDMVHTDYSAMQWKYTKHPKTTLTICVSEVGKRAFLQQYPNEKTDVIYNLFHTPTYNKETIESRKNELKSFCKNEDDLIIVSATRLSWEKGYERMKTFSKRLNELGKHFTWFVFTNDRPNEDIPNFIFMKPTYDVDEYIAVADYYAVMSNTECCSLSNEEAFSLGIPIISTNYPSIFEQGMVNGKTGFILEMDMSNMDEVIKKMFSTKLKFKPMDFNFAPNWEKHLGNHTTSNYEFNGMEIQENISDKWISIYDGIVKDEEQNLCRKGEIVKLYSTERIRVLLDHNMIKRMEE